MGSVNSVLMEARQQVWLGHQFHRGPLGFDEMCKLCVEELQKAKADHIALEVMEQEQADMELLDEEDGLNV